MIIDKLKLLFTHGHELEALLKEMKEQKKQEICGTEKYHLKLCVKHQQEKNRSHYSEENCDYCRLLKFS